MCSSGISIVFQTYRKPGARFENEFHFQVDRMVSCVSIGSSGGSLAVSPGSIAQASSHPIMLQERIEDQIYGICDACRIAEHKKAQSRRADFDGRSAAPRLA
jgi:hypothetical protein